MGAAASLSLSNIKKDTAECLQSTWRSMTPLSSWCAKAEELKLDSQEVTDPIEDLPLYTLADVAKNNGQNGQSVWMMYRGNVYDVTNFIPNHLGGFELFLQAAGSYIEPYWNKYRQRFASDLPMNYLEKMVVGRLDEKDQDMVDELLNGDDQPDPYLLDPERNSSLKMHSEEPANGECPAHLLTEIYLTPNEVNITAI
ncbi:MAG: cytochrome b5 domain-containing protein, partial [Gloeomargaritales cyanobacterium]